MQDRDAVILADGREAREVPADAAGEFALWVANHPLAHLRAVALTPRQADALDALARLYGLGGGMAPGRRHGAGGTRDEADVARDRARFAEMLEMAPPAARGWLLTICQGEWPIAPDVRLAPIRDAADRMADFLRIVGEP